MKLILVILTVAFSLQTFAETREYSCPQNFEFSPLKPGAFTKKVVEVYSTTSHKYKTVKVYDEVISTSRRILTRSEVVSTSVEDVLFDLRARGLFMRIYLDELDQSYISLGKETIHVNCRPKR